MWSFGVYDVFRPAHVVGCVVETDQFMVINTIVFQQDGILCDVTVHPGSTGTRFENVRSDMEPVPNPGQEMLF